MIETIILAVWFVGIGVMGYGVFAAPSVDVEGWFQKDRPYMKIRAIGGVLILLGMVLALGKALS